jgi:selenocysteine lyase/cysteine desulfurase
VDVSALRAEFPVLARLAYLNAGTDGPLPARAAQAAHEELASELNEGRWTPHRERMSDLQQRLRGAYATALGCDSRDVALTSSTSEGMAAVIAGLSLRAGQEILTSDEEHPGLLGALAAAREERGVSVRMAPLEELADAVGPATALVACSHVSWTTGRFAPAALAELDVPVLLDGAQGVGAVAVDVLTLGCDAYAGAGQKWCCGPDSTGMLYVCPELRERLSVPRRGYANMADPNAGLDGGLHEDARRFDTPSQSSETLACAVASIELLAQFGWPSLHRQAAALAARLAEMLAEHGREPQPRDATTLVAFPSSDAEQERATLAAAGVIVRSLPGRPWLRASVGAWNDERDLERLVETLRR